MEIQLSGAVAVSADGSPVDVGPAKCQAVLAALALSAGRPVAVGEIIEAVWGASPPQTADKTLQNYIARLRKGLGTASIEWVGGAYRLLVDVDAVDLVRFQSLLDQGLTDEALALWLGPPFGSLDAPGLDPVRVGLTERWLTAQQHRLGQIVDGPQPDLAIGPLFELTTEHGLREQLWELLMLALYRSGRQADALRTFATIRDRLISELGVEPGAGLRDLEARVLAQDPTLDDEATRPLQAARESPTGTVAFLFTDIEGSTRLWNDHPTEMQAALAIHDRIVKAAIESASGYVFSTAGDSFAAAFATPAEALGAAVAAQTELLGQAFPPPVTLAVRFGLHVGVADERNGDYFGAAPSRAARIMAVADGGQIVVSAAARHVLGDDVPDGVELVDEGEHWLRDLDAAEHLFSVHHPDLIPTRLPPATKLVPPSNLPTQRNSFLGRDREVAEIKAMLEQWRMISLTGVGGVGKTRLATHIAAASLSAFRHGVWLVELAGVATPDQVSERVADVLGLDHHGSGSIVDHLGDKRLLLVLDNCEHLIGPVAQLAAELLDRCPNIRILATSREGLALPGERIVAVPSLALDAAEGIAPAIQLFLDRAAATAGDLEAVTADSAPVQAICRRLDGVPLAIELAAARTSVMSPAEIAGRLDDVFQLLTGGRRTAVERHQTLRAAIDWSFDLLSAQERTVFSRLGVFVDGFTLPAAVAVAGAGELDDYTVIDTISQLVSKSLLVADTRGGVTRFRQLETLRRYALDRLRDQDESERTRSQHATWAAAEIDAFAAQWESPDQVLALDRLASERQNLEAAIRWCVEQADVELAGRMAAGLGPAFLAGPDAGTLLQILVDLPGLDRHPSWPLVIGPFAWLRQTRLDEAAQIWRQVVENGELPPAPLSLAFTRWAQLDMQRWKDHAIPVLEKYWAVNGNKLDIDLVILTATGFGHPETEPSVRPIAGGIIDSMVEVADKTRRPWERAATHWIKGRVVLNNDPDEARSHFEICAAIFLDMKAPLMGPQALSELARLTRTPEAARSLLGALINLTALDNLSLAESNTRRYVYEALTVILALLEQPQSSAIVLGASDAALHHYSVQRRDFVDSLAADLRTQLGDELFDELRQEGADMAAHELYHHIRPAIQSALDGGSS